MNLPNFFIVGAAKAGTSSVFNYLTSHPDIYNTPKKEPCYFAFKDQKIAFKGPGDENLNQSVVTDWDEYLSLFRDVKHEKAVGEASVVYLCHPEAPRAIAEVVPDAKVIIILRSPIDRAYSSFMHKVRDGYEVESSFKAAFELEDARRAEGWQHLWQYRSLSFYGDALERYLSYFPSENIKICLYDDLVADLPAVLKDLFEFLDVDSSFEVDISKRYNKSGAPRVELLQRALTHRSSIKNIFKSMVPARVRAIAREKISDFNVKSQKLDLTSEERANFNKIFGEDIIRTEKLIGQNLSAWLK